MTNIIIEFDIEELADTLADQLDHTQLERFLHQLSYSVADPKFDQAARRLFTKMRQKHETTTPKPGKNELDHYAATPKPTCGDQAHCADDGYCQDDARYDRAQAIIRAYRDIQIKIQTAGQCLNALDQAAAKPSKES